LAAYLTDQQKALADIGDQIRSKEVELSSAIATSEIATQLVNRNSAASRVVGRISLFLENLAPNTELLRLEAEERRLKARGCGPRRKVGR
jgi:hypothetical protein